MGVPKNRSVRVCVKMFPTLLASLAVTNCQAGRLLHWTQNRTPSSWSMSTSRTRFRGHSSRIPELSSPFWYYNGGEKQIQKAQLDASKYNNERYWVVGCVGKKKEGPLKFSVTAYNEYADARFKANQLLIETPLTQRPRKEPSQLRFNTLIKANQDNKNMNQWVRFELPKATCISGFRALTTWKYPDAMFKDYRFESSEDGETWTTVKGGEGETKPWATEEQVKTRSVITGLMDGMENWEGIWRDYTFPKVTAPWFRLFILSSHGYNCPYNMCLVIIDQLDLIPCKADGGAKEQSGGLFTNGFENFFGQLPETELQTGYCTKNLFK